MNKRIIDDITNFIFISDQPQKADIIFLPGGSSPEVPERAAQLYSEGFSDKILPAGAFSVKRGKFPGVKAKNDIYCGDYQTECAFYCDVLKKNGVPEPAIYCEDKSGHTRDNAFLSRQVADEHGLDIRKALICCKSFHARRCLMLYQLAFPDAELLVVPVNCYGINRDNWYLQNSGIDRVLGELARCGSQFAEDVKSFLRGFSLMD